MGAVPEAVARALVSWDHSVQYAMPRDWLSIDRKGFTKTYDLGKEHAYLLDHTVEGRVFMPVIPTLYAEAQTIPCIFPEASLQSWQFTATISKGLLTMQTLMCEIPDRSGLCFLIGDWGTCTLS